MMFPTYVMFPVINKIGLNNYENDFLNMKMIALLLGKKMNFQLMNLNSLQY